MDAALIESAENPQGSWKHVDELVEGWKVKSISDDGVTFMLDRETRVVKLHVDNVVNGIGSPAPGP